MSRLAQDKARSVADLTEGTILASVEIAAPPERVFRALASEEITSWWGDESVYVTKKWTGDVRVGGRWRADGVGADGISFTVGGEFIEVDAPRLLVHTWEPDWAPGPATRVTYRLEPIEGGTRLTLRHTGFGSPEACAGHTDGWAMVLGWLSAHVAPKAPRAAEVERFVIKLVPPRESFMMDMSEAETRIMGEHVAYWSKLLEEGVAIVFGPVGGPQGGWGLGVVELASAAALAGLEAGDPCIKSGAGFRYEVMPLVRSFARPHAGA
jgi:uncharacterized protein YndB with AHSA1/START domain